MAMPPGVTSPSVMTSVGFVLGIEDQNVAQAGIGDKETVVVVHGEANDANEVGVSLVLDEFDFASFRIEDKDGADFLVGDIEIALGIERHAVRLCQLPEHLATLGLRLRAGQTVHPGIFLGLRLVDLREFFRGIKRLIANARNRRWVRPDDVGIVDDGRRRGCLVLFLLFAKQSWAPPGSG